MNVYIINNRYQYNINISMLLVINLNNKANMSILLKSEYINLHINKYPYYSWKMWQLLVNNFQKAFLLSSYLSEILLHKDKKQIAILFLKL
jgi:plasmid rolling circle replication initiator protein Rep